MKIRTIVTACLIWMPSMLAFGQTKGAIKQAIEAKYTLAQPTVDRKDLTAPGAVIVLLKDDLGIQTTGQITTDPDGNPVFGLPPTTTYKNGKFQRSGVSKFFAARTLVAGEKCWLIGDEIKEDGVVLEFLSDPIDGVRFKGLLKFPFPKGQIPVADVVMQQIAETIKAEPMPQAAAAPPTPVSTPAVASAALAPIPPPPPPSDAPAVAPKTISLGQTKAQVLAMFGPPTRLVTLPTKEIDFFPGMKVTFIKGKVADVQ